MNFPGELNKETLWDDAIPSDGSLVIELRYTEFSVTIVTYIFAGLNIILSITSMILMTVYKNRRFDLHCNNVYTDLTKLHSIQANKTIQPKPQLPYRNWCDYI